MGVVEWGSVGIARGCRGWTGRGWGWDGEWVGEDGVLWVWAVGAVTG